MSTNLFYEVYTNVAIPKSQTRGRWARMSNSLDMVLDNTNDITNVRIDFPETFKDIENYEPQKQIASARGAAYNWAHRNGLSKKGLGVQTTSRFDKDSGKYQLFVWLVHIPTPESGLKGTKAIGIEA